MIVFGLILLLIGFLAGIQIVWTIGVIVLVVGLALWLLGSMGHAIGSRRHYY
jgi:fatty-acid desaturase